MVLGAGLIVGVTQADLFAGDPAPVGTVGTVGTVGAAPRPAPERSPEPATAPQIQADELAPSEAKTARLMRNAQRARDEEVELHEAALTAFDRPAFQKGAAVLGMFDVSARPFVKDGVLSFAVPIKKLERMVDDMDESFLITPSWDKVRGRLGSK